MNWLFQIGLPVPTFPLSSGRVLGEIQSWVKFKNLQERIGE
jgi:hypothetical protein